MTTNDGRAANAPSELKTNLLIALLCAIWGSTWIVVKESQNDLPPFTSSGLRMGVAAAVMTVVAFFARGKESGSRPPLWLSATMGIGNLTLTYGLVYWCSKSLPSGMTALLWAVFPMMMAISGHFFLDGERLRGRQWLGFIAGFAGVVILKSDIQKLGDDALFAAALLLLSPLSTCVATTVVKKHGRDVSSVLLNRDGMFIGGLPLLALAFAFERDAQVTWTSFALFSIGYLAVMGTVVTFGIYYWLLRYAPAYKMSLIAYVTPAIAMTIGTIVGQEPFTYLTLLGSLSILGGIALVVTKSRASKGFPG